MLHDLNLGENAIENAPIVQLKDGTNCVPQHFLEYAHTRASVENLVSRIQYDPRYLVFVCQENSEVYIQIGIIGHDNYAPASTQTGPKIVYGRRWRVEPNLPSSEIIQTVFLAIKKAREHEIRELITLHKDGFKTTPFSNHHDLPLMARNKSQLIQQIPQKLSIEQTLSCLQFDGGTFTLGAAQQRPNGQWIIDVQFHANSRDDTQDYILNQLSLLVKDISPNTLFFELCAVIIRESDARVDTYFTFDGFARFNQNVDIFAISELSATTRRPPVKAEFREALKDNNYETDSSRVPQIYPTAYGQKLQESLTRHNVVNGIIPRSKGAKPYAVLAAL